MKLYELTEAYETISNLELSEEELSIHLQNISDEIDTKAENIVKVLKDMDGDIEKLKTAEKELKAKKTALENRKQNLRNYLQSQMELVDKKKIKTDLFTISIQNTQKELNILDETKIPNEFFKVERTLKKAEFKKAVQSGEYQDIAELLSKESMVIRWAINIKQKKRT